MNHQNAGRKFSRDTTARKALLAGLTEALIKNEQIKTTLPKAKDLRRVVEPLITKARTGTLAARREVAKFIRDEKVVKKLFDEVAPRFKTRNGGYTRVLKMGFRQGDAAPMALIELTEMAAAAPTKAEKTAKKAAPAKANTEESKAE